MGGRRTGDPLGLAVIDAQFDSTPEGLLEVIADDLLEFVQTVANSLPQPACTTLVQLRALMLREPFVRCVSKQQVAEPEGVIVSIARTRSYQLLPHQADQTPVNPLPLVFRRQLEDGSIAGRPVPTTAPR